MPRLNKRARHERRFGRSDLIADLILSEGKEWRCPRGFDLKLMVEALSKAPVVDISNVISFWESQEDHRFEWLDLPCCKPPFNSMFIEGKTESGGGRIGFALSGADPGYCLDHIRACTADSRCSFNASKIMNDMEMLESESKFAFTFLVMFSRNGVLIGPIATGIAFLNSKGCVLRPPWGAVEAEICNFWKDPNDMAGDMKRLFYPLFLGLSFMNCKNVTENIVEPDIRINRERRKHDLRPFLRYRTINIEPMKKVLRTHGECETQGFKKALHICRGHFSTYTDENKLFGKVSGTFWIPSHVRGSLKEGAVISDYRVKP